MDLVLYKNFSVHNKLNKNITPIATYEGVQLVNAIDDHDISVEVAIPTGELSWDDVNYFSFDGAYYFLSSVSKEYQDVSVLNGTMDLLMTYKDAIKQLDVFAERSTSHGSARLEDSMRGITVDTDRTVVEFPNSVAGSEVMGTYILNTAQLGFES